MCRLYSHEKTNAMNQPVTPNPPRKLLDQFTILPDSIVEPLRIHLQHVKRIHEKDLSQGYGSVYMP